MPGEEEQVKIEKGYTPPKLPKKPGEEIIEEGYVPPGLPEVPPEEPPSESPGEE